MFQVLELNQKLNEEIETIQQRSVWNFSFPFLFIWNCSERVSYLSLKFLVVVHWTLLVRVLNFHIKSCFCISFMVCVQKHDIPEHLNWFLSTPKLNYFLAVRENDLGDSLNTGFFSMCFCSVLNADVPIILLRSVVYIKYTISSIFLNIELNKSLPSRI